MGGSGGSRGEWGGGGKLHKWPKLICGFTASKATVTQRPMCY